MKSTTHTIQLEIDGERRDVNVTVLAQRGEMCECVYSDDAGMLRYATIRAEELMPAAPPAALSLAQRIGAPWWWRDVKQQPGAFAAIGIGAVIFLSGLLGAASDAAPQQLVVATTATATPALVVPMTSKSYARVLDEQREAYAEPNGEFLGAIEAGRGYAPLYDTIEGWDYVHVEGAGPVWLRESTPAPDAPLVVDSPAPTVAPAPIQQAEYVPMPAPTAAPVVDLTAKHSGPSKLAPWEGGKHPDDARKEGP